MHESITIEKNDLHIPETIRFLIVLSSDMIIDMTDQMARKYTVKLKSWKWSLQIFFTILDLTAINAWILYKETTEERILRQTLLLQLAEKLALEFQELQEIN